MKKSIVFFSVLLMGLCLFANSSFTYTGDIADISGDMPTQTVQLTIDNNLYSYNVGFSTDGKKADNIDATELVLSADDRTVADNSGENGSLYVWWDILTSEKFSITLGIGQPLTEQVPISGEEAAIIDYTVMGTVSKGEVKPANHTTNGIEIASDGTESITFLSQKEAVAIANSYQGNQKLVITTNKEELQGKPEGTYTSTLTLTVAAN